MKKILLSSLVAAAFAVGSSNAQIIAQDIASNYTTATWTNGANLGSGWSAPWVITSNDGGTLIGTSANNGATNSAPLNTSGVSFGLFGTDFVNAGRAFPSLSAGQQFSLGLSFQWDNGNRGINLLSGGSQVFNFNINTSGYTWTGGGVAASTSWVGLRENGVFMTLTFTATTNGFNYAFSSPQAASINNQSGSVTSGALSGFQAYVSGAGGDGGNMYINNLQVVPEPTTYALLTLGALGMSGYAARRRARK